MKTHGRYQLMCSRINALQTVLEQFWYNTGIGMTRLVTALDKVLSVLRKVNREAFTEQLTSYSK